MLRFFQLYIILSILVECDRIPIDRAAQKYERAGLRDMHFIHLSES